MTDVVPPPPAPVPLLEWERKALETLRLLQRERKPAILLLDETGAIRVYRGERAGIVPPP